MFKNAEELYKQTKHCHEELSNLKEENFRLKQQLDNIYFAVRDYRSGECSKGIAFDQIVKEVKHPW